MHDETPGPIHSIEGMRYREVALDLPKIGSVIVLEATLDTQNTLIDLALQEEPQGATTDANGAAPSTTTSTSVVEDIYGAVLWPASLTIASYLLQHDDALLRNQRIVEVGAGTGLVAMAAALGGAQHVLATDYETIPLAIVQAAARRNGIEVVRNETTNSRMEMSTPKLSTQLLDICRYDHEPLPDHMTVLVAADVLYTPSTGRALAHRVLQALQSGAHVVVGDSPGRPGRPAFLEQLEALGIHNAVFENIKGWTVTGERHELICGRTSTTRSDKMRELDVAVMHLDPSDYGYSGGDA